LLRAAAPRGAAVGSNQAPTTKGKTVNKPTVETGEFKGHPTITLGADGQYPFTFGLGKAKLILACLEEVQKFVADNTKEVA